MAKTEIGEIRLLAWMGEDELGSGEIGMKQVFIPGKGVTNLAAVDKHDSWVAREMFKEAMQAQSDMHGKTIYLCKYKLESIEQIVSPSRLSGDEVENEQKD